MRTPEENAAQFVEILRNGGTLIAHPDTLAELNANVLVKLMVPVLMDCRKVPNQYLEIGTLYACAIPLIDEFPMTAFRPLAAEPICAAERLGYRVGRKRHILPIS